jgi:hypothetical protein
VTALAKTRFAYDLEATLQVVLAFWMMKAFIPQEVVPVIITDKWDELKSGFRDAFAMISKEGAELSAVNDDRKVLMLYPRNLHSFTLTKDVKGDPAETVTLTMVTARQARERSFGDHHHRDFEPVTFIDLHRLATWVRRAIMAARWSGPEPFETFGGG